MDLKSCIQVNNTLCAARARVLHPGRSLSYPKKLGLPRRGSDKSNSGLLSFSSLDLSSHRNSRRSSPVCKAREAVDEVQVVTDSSWERLVVASECPVLVEFWAPWCGPCRMIKPVIEELAKEYAGKMVCLKLNTDDCPDVATRCGIRSIPTVLFYKGGERKESIIGAVPKSTLSAAIEKYLSP